MLVLGLGLGLVMQVLVLAAQNAVDYTQLGVATSGSPLFRQIGGSIGVAAFGAIFANQLAGNLAASLPADTQLPAAADPAAIRELPTAVHDAYIGAVTDALQPVFLVAAGIALLAFALTWLLAEVPLKTTAKAPDPGDGFHPAHDDDRLREIERALSELARREQRWQLYERGAVRARVDLPPPQLWLLARIGERAAFTESQLAGVLRVDPDRIAEPLEGLRRRALVRDENGGPIGLTAEGAASYERLVAARCDGLRELLDGWEPDEHPELRRLIDRLGRDLVREMPTPAPGAA